MRLPTMMRLVIEEMHHQLGFLSPHFTVRRTAEPHEVLGQPRVIYSPGPGDDIGIRLFASRPKLCEVFYHICALFDADLRLWPAIEA